MVQFKYSDIMKRYDVKVPFTLAGESDVITVASISEDEESKITLHRDISIKLLRTILLSWDEKKHMDIQRAEREAGEYDELFNGKKKGDR